MTENQDQGGNPWKKWGKERTEKQRREERDLEWEREQDEANEPLRPKAEVGPKRRKTLGVNVGKIAEHEEATKERLEKIGEEITSRKET